MVTKLGKDNSYMLFGATGTMEQNERVHIAKGTKIFAYGFAMSLQYFVVYNDKMDAVEIGSPDEVNTVEDLPERYFSPRHHLDETTRPISKKFGIGFYYDESDEVISDEVINNSLERADKIERLEEEKERQEQRDKEATRERLLKEYSYLERADKFDHKAAGRNIRTELKRAFPGVKFSVRYDSFSGGDSYDVDWTDGPTAKQVRDIIDKYGDMHPDSYSYGDYWDCVPSIFNGLFGSVGYTCANRHLSDEAIQKAMQDNPTLSRDDACDMLYKKDLTPAIEEKKQQKKSESTCKAGNYNVIEYSDKAFAVTGDTKAIKDDLKRLGGRFNAKLRCGAGWIFSNKQREAVEKYLNI